MVLATTRWDSAEHLKTDEDIRLYLEACLEEAGDKRCLQLLKKIIGDPGKWRFSIIRCSVSAPASVRSTL